MKWNIVFSVPNFQITKHIDFLSLLMRLHFGFGINNPLENAHRNTLTKFPFNSGWMAHDWPHQLIHFIAFDE